MRKAIEADFGKFSGCNVVSKEEFDDLQKLYFQLKAAISMNIDPVRYAWEKLHQVPFPDLHKR